MPNNMTDTELSEFMVGLRALFSRPGHDAEKAQVASSLGASPQDVMEALRNDPVPIAPPSPNAGDQYRNFSPQESARFTAAYPPSYDPLPAPAAPPEAALPPIPRGRPSAFAPQNPYDTYMGSMAPVQREQFINEGARLAKERSQPGVSSDMGSMAPVQREQFINEGARLAKERSQPGVSSDAAYYQSLNEKERLALDRHDRRFNSGSDILRGIQNAYDERVSPYVTGGLRALGEFEKNSAEKRGNHARAEKAAGITNFSGAHAEVVEERDPVEAQIMRGERRLEEIEGKKAGVGKSWDYGKLGYLTDQLVGSQVISGNKEAFEKALQLKQKVDEASSSDASTHKGFLDKTLNDIFRMLYPMAEGAAVGLIPGVGGVASAGAWTAQGMGDLAGRVAEQGGDPFKDSAFIGVMGLAYALVERLQVGHALNAAAKKHLTGRLWKRLLSVLVDKGIDAVLETGEEVLQELIVEGGTQEILAKQGIKDYDNAKLLGQSVEAGKEAFFPMVGIVAPGGAVKAHRTAKQWYNNPASADFSLENKAPEAASTPEFNARVHSALQENFKDAALPQGVVKVSDKDFSGDARKILEAVTGKKVVVLDVDQNAFAEVTGGDGFDGFVSQSMPDYIFVTSDADAEINARPLLWTVGHEFWHTKENDVVVRNVIEDLTGLRTQTEGQDSEESLENSEFNADVVGRMLAEPQFWADLAARRNDDAFEKVARATMDTFRGIKERVKGIGMDDVDKRLNDIGWALRKAMSGARSGKGVEDAGRIGELIGRVDGKPAPNTQFAKKAKPVEQKNAVDEDGLTEADKRDLLSAIRSEREDGRWGGITENTPEPSVDNRAGDRREGFGNRRAVDDRRQEAETTADHTDANAALDELHGKHASRVTQFEGARETALSPTGLDEILKNVPQESHEAIVAAIRARDKAQHGDATFSGYDVVPKQKLDGEVFKSLQENNVPFVLEESDVGNVGGANSFFKKNENVANEKGFIPLLGDIYLREVARFGGISARSGGDEFTTLWVGYDNVEDVRAIRELIEKKIRTERDARGLGDVLYGKNIEPNENDDTFHQLESLIGYKKGEALRTGAFHTAFGLVKGNSTNSYKELSSVAKADVKKQKIADFVSAIKKQRKNLQSDEKSGILDSREGVKNERENREILRGARPDEGLLAGRAGESVRDRPDGHSADNDQQPSRGQQAAPDGQHAPSRGEDSAPDGKDEAPGADVTNDAAGLSQKARDALKTLPQDVQDEVREKGNLKFAARKTSDESQDTKDEPTPISSRQFRRLLDRLKATGLAKEVIVDEARMRRYFNAKFGRESADRFMNVWHGSPHAFDEFSLSHVGEGEGNQTYGWGLYFTEVQDIAEHYAEMDSAYDTGANLYKAKVHGDKTADELDFLAWDGKLLGPQKKKIVEQAEKEGYGDYKLVYRDEDGELQLNTSDDVDWLYKKDLTRILGAPKAASEFLLRAGIDGIKYPTGYQSKGSHTESYNYVVFDDKAIEIAEHIRLMATPNGEVYGFATPDGRVFLDPKRMNANTPIHEYGHLWIDFAKKNNKALYDRLTYAAAQSEYYRELKTNPAYKHLTPQQRAEECAARAIGDIGEFKFNSETALERFKKLLLELWQWVSARMGLNRGRGASRLTADEVSGMTLEELSDAAAGELLSGQRIGEVDGEAEGGDRLAFIGGTGARMMDFDDRKKGSEANRIQNRVVAKEMEKAGKSDIAIKMATGWERGVDKKWRYEVPDFKLKANAKKTIAWGGDVTLGGLVSGSEIFTAYPDMKGVPVKAGYLGGDGVQGSFDGAQISVDWGFLGRASVSELEDVLLHETQHAIQKKEGFARGGSPDEFKTERSTGATALDQYRMLAGEVEARNVPARKNMTPEDRRETLARETADVQPEEQRVRFASRDFGSAVTAGVPDGDLEKYPNARNRAKQLWDKMGTASPFFKKWFGDSKVVDGAGKPLVVYHGTNEKFTVFDKGKIGSNTGRLDVGVGFYFSDLKSGAMDSGADWYGTNVDSYYLSMKNPFTVPKDDKKLGEMLVALDENISTRHGEKLSDRLAEGYQILLRDISPSRLTKLLTDKGFDGIISGRQYVAFQPEQIKSATDNAGTFDSGNPDIRFARRGRGGDYIKGKSSQDEGRGDIMAKAEMYRKGIRSEDAYKKLFARIEESGDVVTLRNDNDGEEALLSKRSVRKLLSGKATDKSVANGFTAGQHFAVAADIEDVFAGSVKILSRPDRDGNQDVTIHRFATPLHFKDAMAFLTVKESKPSGKRMYSVELMEIKKLGGMLEETGEISRAHPLSELDLDDGGNLTHPENLPRGLPAAPRVYNNNIRKLREAVNSKTKKGEKSSGNVKFARRKVREGGAAEKIRRERDPRWHISEALRGILSSDELKLLNPRFNFDDAIAEWGRVPKNADGDDAKTKGWAHRWAKAEARFTDFARGNPEYFVDAGFPAALYNENAPDEFDPFAVIDAMKGWREDFANGSYLDPSGVEKEEEDEFLAKARATSIKSLTEGLAPHEEQAQYWEDGAYRIPELVKKPLSAVMKDPALKDPKIGAVVFLNNGEEFAAYRDENTREYVVEDMYGEEVELPENVEVWIDAVQNTESAKIYRAKMADKALKMEHAGAIRALADVLAKEFKRLNALQGSRASTLTLGANKAIIDLLKVTEMNAKGPKLAKVKQLLAFYNNMAQKRVRENKDAPVANKDRSYVEGFEAVPDYVTRGVSEAFADAFDDLTVEGVLGLIQQIEGVKGVGAAEKKLEILLERKQRADNIEAMIDRMDKDGKLRYDLNNPAYSKIAKRRNKAARAAARAGEFGKRLMYQSIRPERLFAEFDDIVGKGEDARKDPTLLTNIVFNALLEGDDGRVVGVENVISMFKKLIKGVDPLADQHTALKGADGKPLKFMLVNIAEEKKLRKQAEKAARDAGVPFDEKTYNTSRDYGTRKEETVTIADAMFVYQHSQNADGRRHLVATGFTEDSKDGTPGAITQIINALPEKYKDVVDKLIDYYDNEQYDRINPVFEREHSVPMDKVKRYSPIRRLDTSGRPVSEQVKDEGARRAAVKKGFTKTRVGSAAPFDELNFYTSNMAALLDAEKYIAMNDAIRNANKYLLDEKLSKAMKAKSELGYEEIMKMLHDVAGSSSERPDWLSEAVRSLARNFTVAKLAGNMMTWTKQTISLLQAIPDTSFPHFVKAVALLEIDVLGNGISKDILAKSAMMRNRADNIERVFVDMAESGLLNKVAGQRLSLKQGAFENVVQARNMVNTALMYPIQAVDMHVAKIVWLAKYSEIMGKTKNEKAAIAAADRIVRTTQSQGGELHLPSMYRSKNTLARSFTMFTNDANQLLNLLREDIKGWKNRGHVKSAFRTAWHVSVTPIMLHIINAGVGSVTELLKHPPWEDPEEWENFINDTLARWLSWEDLLDQVPGTLLGGIPVVGDVAEAGGKALTNRIRKAKGKETQRVLTDIGASPMQGVGDDIKKALENGLVRVPDKGKLADMTEPEREKALKNMYADVWRLVDIAAASLGVGGAVPAKRLIGAHETGDPRRALWSEYALQDKSTDAAMVKRADQALTKPEEYKRYVEWYEGLSANQQWNFDRRYEKALDDMANENWEKAFQIVKETGAALEEYEYAELMQKEADDERAPRNPRRVAWAKAWVEDWTDDDWEFYDRWLEGEAGETNSKGVKALRRGEKYREVRNLHDRIKAAWDARE